MKPPQAIEPPAVSLEDAFFPVRASVSKMPLNRNLLRGVLLVTVLAVRSSAVEVTTLYTLQVLGGQYFFRQEKG
jgi:hypothetical protein